MSEGLIIGIVSLAIGIVATRYYSTRRSISLIACQRKILDPVTGSYPEGLQITLDGTPVNKLSEWKIFLWNSGNSTIENSEISHPISFTFLMANILGSPQIESSKSPNKPSISLGESKSSFELRFDYLDSGDAVAATVYTSHDTEPNRPPLLAGGQVKGLPRGFTICRPPVHRTNQEHIRSIVWILFLVFQLWYWSDISLASAENLEWIGFSFRDETLFEGGPLIQIATVFASALILIAFSLFLFFDGRKLLRDRFGVPKFVRERAAIHPRGASL